MSILLMDFGNLRRCGALLRVMCYASCQHCYPDFIIGLTFPCSFLVIKQTGYSYFPGPL